MRRRLTVRLIMIAAGVLGSLWRQDRLGASTYAEVEPNNTKFTANVVPFPMVAGDTLTGFTIGASTTLPDDFTPDNFLLQTAQLPPGIYQHRLRLTVPASASDTYNSFIMGLQQVGGVIQPNTEAIAQTAPPNGYPTHPRRTVSWYGFGRGERLYYRVSGNSTTTQPYTATLSTIQVQPQIVPDVLVPGQITIADASTSPFHFFDAWIYDANLNAIPGYGPSTSTSLTRNFAAGTYFVALSQRDFSNNQAAPPGGPGQDSPVLDFPDVAVTAPNTFGTNVNVIITDSAGNHPVAADLPGPYDTVWLQLTVSAGCTCAGDMDGNLVFDGRDIPAFTAALIAGSGNCADINNDSQVSTDDIAPFINLLLSGQPCA